MLDLPDFKDSHSFYFQACGQLSSGGYEEERREYVARYKTVSGLAYLRFLAGGGKRGRHFHVDIALSRIFKGQAAPKVNSTRLTIEQEIFQRLDQPLEVHLLAQYAAPVSDVNTDSGIVFAGPSAVASTVNGTPVEIAGAHLFIRNHDFVRTIDWELYKDGLFADVYAQSTTAVTRSYLTDLFRRAEDAFNVYILGSKTHDGPA